MNELLKTINAFLEDTSVLIAIVYVVTRGKMLRRHFERTTTEWRLFGLGTLLGLLGLTELAFPGARYPYMMHTLLVAFAAYTLGVREGVAAATVIALGSLFFQAPPAAAGTFVTVFAIVYMAAFFSHGSSRTSRVLTGALVGMLAQAIAQIIGVIIADLTHSGLPMFRGLVSIPTNGVGVALLIRIIQDGQLRVQSEQNRAEAEKGRALVAEAELSALRTRIQPHFLFNALTSIAALCSLAPEKAEDAITHLGQLMRRTLESDAGTPVSLVEEAEQVRHYVQIEQYRLGHRLHFTWDIGEDCENALLPPFALQTLVENAIQHGVAAQPDGGHVVVRARCYRKHLLLAVVDDGIGMDPAQRREALQKKTARPHGLQILSAQLERGYGHPSRVRLFSRIERGTLAVFILPYPESGKMRTAPIRGPLRQRRRAEILEKESISA